MPLQTGLVAAQEANKSAQGAAHSQQLLALLESLLISPISPSSSRLQPLSVRTGGASVPAAGPLAVEPTDEPEAQAGGAAAAAAMGGAEWRSGEMDWRDGDGDVTVAVTLPPGTKARDIICEIKPTYANRHTPPWCMPWCMP
eukprot:SAG11_NODE_1430_length_4938_cov_7.155197_4_plen_142_part_00